ncbi:MAG: cyclic nucleotide-binding domain-containing protein [Anaerolineales bacterium]|nr:cyclic nucleotide-binding domain-containing protein [Anaerolineales bacterium]
MTNKLAFFGEHPVFRNLSEEQLRALCRIVREYSFDDTSVIAYQRDVADRMVIVINGRLYSRQVDQHGRVREAHTRGYTANQYFGADWLFTPGTYPATVTGSEPGHIFIISNDDFLQFLRDYPEAIEALEPEFDANGEYIDGLPMYAWEQASKLSFVERREKIGIIRLLPDEIVEYYARRSIWYLFVRVFYPLLAMIIIPLLVLYFSPSDLQGSSILFEIGLVLPVLIFGSMIIFRILDWTNDYFVITNKHISNREFDLRTFRTELNKVPIEQIQSVEVVKPTLTSNIFDIGTVRITTAAMVGMMQFDNIDNPIEVKETLERLQRHVRDFDVALSQTKMRQSVEEHFKVGLGYEVVPSDEDEEENLPEVVRFSLWKRIGDLFDWREVEGTTITYRKNYLILFLDILGPSLVYLLLFAILIGVTYSGIMSFWATLASLALFFGFNTFWFVWMFEDWRNDIFQLTDRYVIDIDRKPFGFGESRKQALLSNIQNISAERPGFWATLFNYGDVNIDTAGSDSDITFERVPSPSQILSEIFDRLDGVRQDQRRRDGAERREEYALLLDVYKQEIEQGRIPQRTPRNEEEL